MNQNVYDGFLHQMEKHAGIGRISRSLRILSKILGRGRKAAKTNINALKTRLRSVIR